MEMSRRFYMVMLLVSAFLILLIIYWDIVSAAHRNHVQDRQEHRRLLLKEVCSSNGFPGKNRSFDDIPEWELDHLIVDDLHKIIYCYVPKVECSVWKRVMIVLSGVLGFPYKDLSAISIFQAHDPNMHFTFNKFRQRYGEFSRQFMKMKLKKYTKFLFVRDPFVRLTSAYREKLERRNEPYYQSHGKHILQHYAHQRPPASYDASLATGIRPSFAHFVQYLIDPQTERNAPFDEHWRQMHRLCHPCQIQYDFVGHMESMDEDAEQLLRQLRVDDVVKFPKVRRSITDGGTMARYFDAVPLEARRKLYKLYEHDFRLFGYQKPDILNE